MKVTILLLLIALQGAGGNQPEGFPCEVKENDIVLCYPPKQPGRPREELTADISWKDPFIAWFYNTTSWNQIQPDEVRPEPGEKLRAKWSKDGKRLVPIERCNVRIWRQVQRYARAHPGEPVSLAAVIIPPDCPPDDKGPKP